MVMHMDSPVFIDGRVVSARQVREREKIERELSAVESDMAMIETQLGIQHSRWKEQLDCVMRYVARRAAANPHDKSWQWARAVLMRARRRQR
jgi:hypothetical protein